MELINYNSPPEPPLTVADRVQHLALGLVFKTHNTNVIPRYLTDYFLKVKDRHN